VLNAERWVLATNDKIASFITDAEKSLSHMGNEAEVFIEQTRAFLTGGKRFRAICTLVGFASATSSSPGGPDETNAIAVAAGLEFFHAAALVHDDIMDRSDTRRGKPSAHRAFDALHLRSGYAGDADRFGVSSALLFGDLLLAFSDELVTAGIGGQGPAGRRARAEFNNMRRDVTVGQYLDIVEEVAWPVVEADTALDRAIRVVTYKSAKYSIEAPLRIGAALGGADQEVLDGLSRFGLPLGIAFQLRDDLLGVFGDEAQTGKPVGDDLREGKRTALIAIAESRLGEATTSLAGLGDDHLSPARVAEIQLMLRNVGAEEAVERMISEHLAQAHAALDDAPVADDVRAALGEIAQIVTARSA
jgi:geranylgeranyl diphosphate synthase type I